MSAENGEDTIMEEETEMPLEEVDEENKLFLVRILTIAVIDGLSHASI